MFGSRLPFEVLSFIARAEKLGSRAFDPEILKRLRRVARSSWEGAYVAISAPVAEDTWEIRTQLDSADSSANGQLTFDRPVRVVAAYMSIVVTDPASGLLVPTLDDLELLLTVDNQRQFTQGTQTTSTGSSRGFVTATAMQGAYPGPGRMFGRALMSPSPILNLTVRPKRGAGIYKPIDFRMSLMCDYVRDNGSADGNE